MIAKAVFPAAISSGGNIIRAERAPETVMIVGFRHDKTSAVQPTGTHRPARSARLTNSACTDGRSAAGRLGASCVAAPTTAPGPEEPLKTPGGSLPDNDLGIQNVQIRTGRAVIGLEQTAAQ